jgi:hypothetical protein
MWQVLVEYFKKLQMAKKNYLHVFLARSQKQKENMVFLEKKYYPFFIV